MNVYLSAVDDLLRHRDDQPSIELLLCRSKDRVVVEYALRDLNKPIGVAGWKTKLVEKLPKELKGSLPTVEEIEAELSEYPQSAPRAPRREAMTPINASYMTQTLREQYAKGRKLDVVIKANLKEFGYGV